MKTNKKEKLKSHCEKKDCYSIKFGGMGKYCLFHRVERYGR